jgi:molecular chaperone HtpG
VDEWVVSHLTEFEGKSLASVAKGEADLGALVSEEEKKQQEQQAGEFKDVIEQLKKSLGERVKEVRVSSRLTDSPSCLVADEHDMGGNMARILKAAGQKAPQTAPIMEINPGHALVQRLRSDSSHFDDWASILFDQALLAEGGQLEDPASFVRRLNGLMLGLSGA